jgi:hypothetical protein
LLKKSDFGWRSLFNAAKEPSFSAQALAPEAPTPSFSALCEAFFYKPVTGALKSDAPPKNQTSAMSFPASL